MNPKITPATGRLLSPEAQQRLPARAVRHLSDLHSAKALAEDDMKFLAALLLPSAAGGEMLRDDLVEWLKTELKPLLVPETIFYFGDAIYYIPTLQDMRDAWQGSALGGLIATPQRFDCDDFAFAFKGHCSRIAYFRGDWKLCGLCVGFVSGYFGWAGGRHVANLFVEYDNGVTRVKFLEPANGTPHSLAECKEIYGLFI